MVDLGTPIRKAWMDWDVCSEQYLLSDLIFTDSIHNMHAANANHNTKHHSNTRISFFDNNSSLSINTQGKVAGN